MQPFTSLSPRTYQYSRGSRLNRRIKRHRQREGTKLGNGERLRNRSTTSKVNSSLRRRPRSNVRFHFSRGSSDTRCTLVFIRNSFRFFPSKRATICTTTASVSFLPSKRTLNRSPLPLLRAFNRLHRRIQHLAIHRRAKRERRKGHKGGRGDSRSGIQLRALERDVGSAHARSSTPLIG